MALDSKWNLGIFALLQAGANPLQYRLVMVIITSWGAAVFCQMAIYTKILTRSVLKMAPAICSVEAE